MMTDDDTLRERIHYFLDRLTYLHHWNTDNYQIIIHLLARPHIRGAWPEWGHLRIFDWSFCLVFIEVRKWAPRTSSGLTSDN